MAAVASTSSATASELQTQFLTLLATQLSNQNPLEPMESSDMTAQLASLTELEQMEALNLNFNSLMKTMTMGEATDMLGALITFFPTDSNGVASEESVTGIVTEINVVDSEPKVKVGTYDVAMDEIIQVTYPTYE